MDTLLQDVRYGARRLVRSPAFTLIAILTLALGIGANSAIFSVVNAVLLRPLGYAEPDRLYMIYERNTEGDGGTMRVTPLDYLDWREKTHAFEAVAAHTGRGFTLTGDGEPELVIGQFASPELFGVLGVQPIEPVRIDASERARRVGLGEGEEVRRVVGTHGFGVSRRFESIQPELAHRFEH